MIIKISIIAIICIFVSSMLKKYNQEFSAIVSACGGVIIFLICVDQLEGILEYFTEIYNVTNFDFSFLSVILKIVGVGYITEFTADIAEDFGDKAISSKVLLGGKIVICGIALPIIKELLSVLLSLLS